MWLVNTETLKLENITSPLWKGSYAILSHTWENEEITFQNFSDLASALNARGFTKIQKTCQLAKEKYGLEYAWVDTCCIDKTSSAELSEAINSMFRWYQAAAVCFVYLSDMPSNPIGISHGPGEDALGVKGLTHEQLEKCKWFNRGWTLQELLAPRNVEFYDANWDFISTKDSWLLGPLSDITGIDTACLRNGSQIWNQSIGTRMQWASDRKTTRPEDTAYCLLGIFEINMPLLYGEGSKAFLRLQEEICKQTNDLSLFAWTTQPGHASSLFDKYRGILATHPCEFAGFRGIERRPGEVTFCGELAVTNKGLRFDDIQLYKSEAGLILPVDCIGSGPKGLFRSASYGILLMLTLDGYIRREPSTLAVLPLNRVSDIPPHRIYIQKQMSINWTGVIQPEHRYSDAIFFRFQGEADPIIMNVIPQDSFDYDAKAFLTGGRRFFGYIRLHVNGLELMIICWLKTPAGKGDSPPAPPEAQYSFAVEGEDGWDRLKIMILEKEIANRAVQEGIIPSLLPDPKLACPHDKIIAPLGSTGIEMVLDSTMTSKRRHQMVVTFLRRTKTDSGDSNAFDLATRRLSSHLPFISTRDMRTGRRGAFSV